MGNAFVHTELSVDDVAAAKQFYKTLFNWKLNDLGPAMGNYVMIDLGSKTSGGGITGKMSPTQPTGWLSYVEVDSVKDTISRAEQAGATVVVPYQPIGEMGAIGVFVDPQGASLGLWEKAKQAPKPAAKKSSTKKSSAKKPAKKASAKKLAKRK